MELTFIIQTTNQWASSSPFSTGDYSSFVKENNWNPLSFCTPLNIKYFHFCCSLSISVEGDKINLIWINRRCEKESCQFKSVCVHERVHVVERGAAPLGAASAPLFEVVALWRWPISKKHSSALRGELGDTVSWRLFACGYCDQRQQNAYKPIYLNCLRAAFQQLPWASCQHVMTFAEAYEALDVWVRNMTKGRKCINYKRENYLRKHGAD